MIDELSVKQHKWLKRTIKYDSADLSKSQHFAKEYRTTRRTKEERTGLSVFDRMVQDQMRAENCDHAAAYAMTIAGLYNRDLVKRAVARRIIKNSPRELMEHLSLMARLSWLDDCHPCGLRSGKEVNVWNIILALAAGDFAAAEAYVLHGGAPARGASPTVLLYNFLRAMLLREDKSIAKSLKTTATSHSSNRDKAALYCLEAIATSNASGLAESLEFLLSTYRRSVYVSEPEKIVSLWAHAFAELACMRNPGLMADFKVHRKLPWDADYYSWMRKRRFTVTHLAILRKWELLYDWATNMNPPSWWYTKGKRL